MQTAAPTPESLLALIEAARPHYSPIFDGSSEHTGINSSDLHDLLVEHGFSPGEGFDGAQYEAASMVVLRDAWFLHDRRRATLS
jgi:hypothetical protein